VGLTKRDGNGVVRRPRGMVAGARVAVRMRLRSNGLNMAFVVLYVVPDTVC
jgi:hypothetical protein